MKAVLETYMDRDKDKRWRVVANGKKISMSSEGYVRNVDRRRSIELTLEACQRWLAENPAR